MIIPRLARPFLLLSAALVAARGLRSYPGPRLGVALAREGSLEEALPEFAEALRLQPGYPEARTNLAAARQALQNLVSGHD